MTAIVISRKQHRNKRTKAMLTNKQISIHKPVTIGTVTLWNINVTDNTELSQ